MNVLVAEWNCTIKVITKLPLDLTAMVTMYLSYNDDVANMGSDINTLSQVNTTRQFAIFIALHPSTVIPASLMKHYCNRHINLLVLFIKHEKRRARMFAKEKGINVQWVTSNWEHCSILSLLYVMFHLCIRPQMLIKPISTEIIKRALMQGDKTHYCLRLWINGNRNPDKSIWQLYHASLK
jgi:hypothetical protein